MTSIEYIGMTPDSTYYFKVVEDGDVLFFRGRNETGTSASLRFVLVPIDTAPPGLRFYDSFRLYGQDGALTTEWQGEMYQSTYNLLPTSDGGVLLTTTPQMTDAQIAAARRAETASATAGNAVSQAATNPAAATPTRLASPTTAAPAVVATPPAPDAGAGRAGIGIGALVLGAFALYALLS